MLLNYQPAAIMATAYAPYMPSWLQPVPPTCHHGCSLCPLPSIMDAAYVPSWLQPMPPTCHHGCSLRPLPAIAYAPYLPSWMQPMPPTCHHECSLCPLPEISGPLPAIMATAYAPYVYAPYLPSWLQPMLYAPYLPSWLQPMPPTCHHGHSLCPLRVCPLPAIMATAYAP